jgi:hypothetical protein
MDALLNGRSRGERHKPTPAEHGPHQRIVEFAPVVVDGVGRLGEEHTEAGRPDNVRVRCHLKIRTLHAHEERGVQGLGRGRLGGDRVV